MNGRMSGKLSLKCTNLFEMYRLAHFLRDKLPFIWDVVDWLNTRLFSLRYGRKLKLLPGILKDHTNSFDISSHLSLKSTASLNIIFNPNSGTSYGYGFGELLKLKDSSGRHLDLSLAYFNTDNYDARVYAYEPSLLYSLGVTSYAYHGIRATLHVSLPIFKSFTFNCKLATTKYFNRESIGTAL